MDGWGGEPAAIAFGLAAGHGGPMVAGAGGRHHGVLRRRPVALLPKQHCPGFAGVFVQYRQQSVGHPQPGRGKQPAVKLFLHRRGGPPAAGA